MDFISGKTIEVLNTDAEGRLVLADALSYTEMPQRHCGIFGKVSEERYQGVLDGLDLTMELSQSIKTFEKDIKEYRDKIA